MGTSQHLQLFMFLCFLCMKAVAKLIIGVRVRVIMCCNLSSQYAENSSQYAAPVRPFFYILRVLNSLKASFTSKECR